MTRRERRGRTTKTNFIEFESHKCEACWKCVEVCSSGVIGKINLFFHKHARIINSGVCKGCLKCVKVCAYGALSRIN